MKKIKFFKTKGKTIIETEENYILNGEDLLIDNKLRMIKSNNNSTLQDLDGNKIMIENFEYQVNEGLFRSIGNIEIQDVKNNKYEFSQVYIDTKKNKYLA